MPELPSGRDTAAAALETLSTGRALEVIGSLPRDQAEAVLLGVIVGLDGPRQRGYWASPPEPYAPRRTGDGKDWQGD